MAPADPPAVESVVNTFRAPVGHGRHPRARAASSLVLRVSWEARFKCPIQGDKKLAGNRTGCEAEPSWNPEEGTAGREYSRQAYVMVKTAKRPQGALSLNSRRAGGGVAGAAGSWVVGVWVLRGSPGWMCHAGLGPWTVLIGYWLWSV